MIKKMYIGNFDNFISFFFNNFLKIVILLILPIFWSLGQKLTFFYKMTIFKKLLKKKTKNFIKIPYDEIFYHALYFLYKL